MHHYNASRRITRIKTWHVHSILRIIKSVEGRSMNVSWNGMHGDIKNNHDLDCLNVRKR